MKIALYSMRILVAASIMGALWTSYRYFSTAHFVERATQTTVVTAVDTAATQLDKRFSAITKTINDLSTWISSAKHTDQEFAKHIEHVLKNNEDFYGIVLGYVPYAFDKQKRLYGPYFVQIDKKIERRDITYDYTLPSEKAGARTEWYNDALLHDSTWAEPFYGTASKKHVITYSVRIYESTDTKKERPIGIVGAVISLDNLRNIVSSLELGSAGYGFVISRKGAFAAHPIDEYYLKEKNIFDLAQEKNNQSLKTIAQTITSNSAGALAYTDEVSGQNASLIYRALSSSNLILAATFLHDELLAPYSKQLRTQLMLLAIAFTIMGTMLALYLLFAYGTTQKIVITCASLVSVLLLSGIISIWVIVRRHAQEGEEQHIVLLSDASINKVANSLTKQSGTKPPLFIKTGILLQSVRYVATSQIHITGQIWQRYPSQLDTTIARDFIIPSCESFSIKEIIFRQKTEQEELIVWAVSGLLNQEHFSSQYYPFDEQNIRIAIVHPFLNGTTLLTPDLSSYAFITPRLLPGLLPSVNIDGRFLIKSFFSLHTVNKNVNLIAQASEAAKHNYQLNFTVITDRFLGNALIIYLLPVFVALIFLSVIPVFVTSDLKNTLSSISLMAGIFLALSFTHLQMRKAIIESGGICYLEYYYILLYIFICLAITYAAIHYLAPHSRIFNKGSHLLIKTMLWPVYLLLAFVITAFTFLV